MTPWYFQKKTFYITKTDYDNEMRQEIILFHFGCDKREHIKIKCSNTQNKENNFDRKFEKGTKIGKSLYCLTR